MENTRTYNVIKNISWTVPMEVFLMVLQFISRTFFVRYLGKEYLGLSGLFTEIIWILDLANLRIPEAIIISMYKPLAEKQIEKVRALLRLIGKAFYIIGLAVMVLGLVTMPFLKYIMKDPPNIPENFTIIFFIYLFQSVITYYISYKQCIFFADQKRYIFKIYQKVFHFIQIIFQIIILLAIRKFYLFLSAQILCTLVMNIVASRKAGKMYPFINEKNTYKLDKEEISGIIVNIKSMFIYGLGATLIVGVDNILVSSLIGIGVLGLCSNYMLVVNSIKTLVDQVMYGFTASIGNLNAKEDMEATENIFNQVFFISFMLYAFLSINLSASLNYLITVWLGESFLLAQPIIIIMILRLYVQGTQYVTFTFRSTLDLLKKFKYIPLITAGVNVVLSIVMGRYFGVSGIFLASSIAVFFFTILPEAYLLYTYKFKKSFGLFIFRYLGYMAFMGTNYFITGKLLSLLIFPGWIGFFTKAALGAIISVSLFIIVFFRDKNFRAICTRLVFLIKPKKNIEK